MSVTSKPVRFTSRVRRGLILMRQLLVDSFDDGKPQTSVIVARWKNSEQKDFNLAMEWLEQLEARESHAPVDAASEGGAL